MTLIYDLKMYLITVFIYIVQFDQTAIKQPQQKVDCA
jgi:hypothetical protein